jgi:methionine-rich copper-binding protein CopC
VGSVPEADAELTQPPARIELWFSEPLEPSFSTVRVLTSSGEQAPSGAMILDPADATHMTLPMGNLEPGVYTVAWQTLSQVDGHEFSGSFPITVLNPDGSRPTGEEAAASDADRIELPMPAEVFARWWWLLGCAALFGATFFQLAVLPDSPLAGRPQIGSISASGR